MYRKQVILSIPIAAAVSLLSDASAGQYRNLCMSAANYCTYTGPDAPLMQAEVCLSRAGVITHKGTAPCPSDTRAYYVEHGEVVDPHTGQVEAYIPLDDACSQGMCDKGPPPDGTLEFPMYCYVDGSGTEVCVNGLNCGGTLWFCYYGVCNDDGTVTCFEGNQQG